MDWSDRYSTPLSVVFTRKHKLELEWNVELALLGALEEHKRIPPGSYDKVKAVIDCEYARGS
jgi:adenylosuccinate lyase